MTGYPVQPKFKSINYAGHKIEGPGIIMDKLSTILVEPGCTAVITKKGNFKNRNKFLFAKITLDVTEINIGLQNLHFLMFKIFFLFIRQNT